MRRRLCVRVWKIGSDGGGRDEEEEVLVLVEVVMVTLKLLQQC